MKVKDVVKRLNNETKAAVLAIELNVTDKGLRNGLKQAGFHYDNSKKVWEGNEDSQKSLDTSIFDYVSSKGNRSKKQPSQRSNNDMTRMPQRTAQTSNINSPKSNIEGEIKFTQEEISALKEIVHQYMNEKADETDRERIHKRIIKLPNEDMTRKTVVINKGIGERLDAFASRMKFHKSDILTLALMDFLDKYENE